MWDDVSCAMAATGESSLSLKPSVKAGDQIAYFVCGIAIMLEEAPQHKAFHECPFRQLEIPPTIM